MPFRVGPIGAFASPNLPARQGISPLRHAQKLTPIGGSRLSARTAAEVTHMRHRRSAVQSSEMMSREARAPPPSVSLPGRVDGGCRGSAVLVSWLVGGLDRPARRL